MSADWLFRCLLSGQRVIVPAIVHYELRRELLRAQKTFGLVRLDGLVSATPGRYLPLSDEALRLAADLWARASQDGQPIADPKALDSDVILAAQGLSFGPAPADMIVATTNPGHLAQFIAAKDWQEIVP
jgi:predicted nucleic acid-binding protein